MLKLVIFADTIEFSKLQNYCMDLTRDHYLRSDKFIGSDKLNYIASVTNRLGFESYDFLREFYVLQLHYRYGYEDRESVEQTVVNSL